MTLLALLWLVSIWFGFLLIGLGLYNLAKWWHTR